MIREALVWVALAATLTACTFGHGPLKPIAGPGVTLVSTHGLPNDTARLNAGGVTADVIGDWGARGEGVEVQYRSGPAASRIEMQFRFSWKGAVAPATAAHDVTKPEAVDPGGRLLIAGSVLSLPPGAHRSIDVNYDRKPSGDHPKIGDEIAVAIPMPGGARTVRFRVAWL